MEPLTIKIPVGTMAELVHCDHVALKAAGPSSPQWLALRLVGLQPGEGYGPDLELRDCPACGSCLAVELPSRVQR